MKKYIQDYCVLGILCIVFGFLGAAIRDWSGIDLKFVSGFLVGAFYYDWYKKQ